jgi:uncharacterized protein YndB with AHSA1/START domain
MAASEVSVVIRAPRHAVYQACLDPDAIAAWRVPDNMTAEVHAFDPCVGGGYRISLSYRDGSVGKTSDHTDSFEGRFAELVPDEKIVETVAFDTDQAKFGGEMTITTRLADADGGTRVTMSFENMPAGVSPADNEEGTRQSLRKLAALLE